MEQLKEFEKKYIKKRPKFNVGDTVKVYVKIVEGKKERIQAFIGTVIAKKGGGGISETFSVYKNAYGSAIERTFLLHSPSVDKIEVLRRGDVRKSKLYYIRGESGKKAKVKEKILKEAKTKKEKVLKEVRPEKPEKKVEEKSLEKKE